MVFQFPSGFTDRIGLVIFVINHFTDKNWESNVVNTKEELLIGALGILQFKDFDLAVPGNRMSAMSIIH